MTHDLRARRSWESPTQLHVFQLSDSVSIVPFRLNYIDIRAALISTITAREKEVLISTSKTHS